MPDRDAAREAARDELSRAEYDAAQPPLFLRLLGRAVRELAELLGRAAGGIPGGRLGVLLLVLLVGGAVALLLVRLRPSARMAQRDALFGPDTELSAAEHRELAERAAAQGRFADAVRERLRALVRELEAAGVLEPRPGRTAGEVARDGGAAVPSLADDLLRATIAFGEVWYGGRAADAATYQVLVDVDRAVTGTRLVPA